MIQWNSTFLNLNKPCHVHEIDSEPIPKKSQNKNDYRGRRRKN
jgi:hypothetical protein